MNPIKIAKDFAMPLEAATQTFAILAKRGSGKTYTASTMAEEFVSAGIPFVVLDPTGAWWGLRASADGKSAGLPVTIIGGAHGDVPLEPTAGRVIADLVTDHPGFFVIDMSHTNSGAEQDRFAMEFAERLFRAKAHKPEVLHLFIDEADSFAPQRPLPGQQRMLGAFEALVRRGRNHGIGATFITQRPAVLNKNVISQTEVLIVLQTTSPHDKEAIRGWLKDNAPEQVGPMMESITRLQLGEAWIWSPRWLECFRKVQIRTRHTFNSSATPKAGEQRISPKLAPVDLEKLGETIKSTVERAKENDPAILKRTISELKQKVTKLEQTVPQVEQKTVEVPVFDPTCYNLVDKAMADVQDLLIADLNDLLKGAQSIWESLKAIKLRAANLPQAPVPNRQIVSLHNPNIGNSPAKSVHWETPGVTAEIKDRGGLPKCERAILSALAAYPNGRTKTQVAIRSGYSVNSGGFNNALGALRTSGLITHGSPLQITKVGLATLGEYRPLQNGPGLVEQWMNKLPKCERSILEKVLAYPSGLSKDELGQLTGYSPTSGGFNNALGALRTLELITRGNPISLSPDFFQ